MRISLIVFIMPPLPLPLTSISRARSANPPTRYKITTMSRTVPTIPRPPRVPHLEYPVTATSAEQQHQNND